MVKTFFCQIESRNGIPPDEMALGNLLRRAEVRCVQDGELIRKEING